MKRKFLPIMFIGGLVLLILFQKEIVMPVVKDVVSSDLFLVDTNDEGSRLSQKSSMTNYAFHQCNEEVREFIDSEIQITFPNEPLQAWALGNYKYLVNAEIELNSDAGASFFKRYACQIQYDEEDDMSGVADKDNWDIIGLSGLSEI